MAARRIASSSINWTALAERVPDNQRPFFISLKSRSDGYLRRVLANPEAPPKLNFGEYKSKIPIAGLVDSLQKQYDALKVPYPADKLTTEVNAQEKSAEQTIKQFVAASNARIQEHQKKLAAWDDVLPFEEMTLEDAKDMFPELVVHPLTKPTFWPHQPEDQLDYKPPQVGGAH